MTAMRPLPDGPLIAWYGDDFTGSAAVMELLTFSGYPAVLFFGVPSDEQLNRFGTYRGIGIAGISRSKGTDWMDRHLPPIYAFLTQVGAPIRHYKTCSTLDSSPYVGSIGRAIDLAIGPGDWAPIVMGAPEIGRYQAFGNLFARAGEAVYRLDRHPTMSVHPVTPMEEGDIRLHLEKQTDKKAGLVDIAVIKHNAISAALSAEIAAGKQMIALDVVDEETMAKVGEEIWARAEDGLFAVGSQGVEYALVAAWKQLATNEAMPALGTTLPVDRVAVVSGSCSPINAQQIDIAGQNGFAVVRLDPLKALDADDWARECAAVTHAALSRLSENLSPLVCTATGSSDPSISRLADAVKQSDLSSEDVNERIGIGLGQILSGIIAEGKLKRVAIAGGDSSSHGAQQLGLYAVTAKASLEPAAGLLAGHSECTATDGLEIALKGGQMGSPDYFVKLRDGLS